MSRVFEALRRVEEKRCFGAFRQPAGLRKGAPPPRGLASQPHSTGRGQRYPRVVTLASLKGGVGKTVIAANLAVYLRNLRPQVPTLLLACDDDPLPDRMFARNEANPGAVSATSPPASPIQGGRHGVYTVRPSRRSWGLGSELEPDPEIAHLFGATHWDGLVVVDTPPDFGARTRAALAASDVVLIPVSDAASLDKVAQLFALMDDWGLPRDGVHLVLSQLDLRIKYREGESRDVLALLVSEIRRRGWPLLGAFLSRTPKVASLYTKESGRPLPVVEAAPESVVHRQFLHLADDVLGLLARASQRTTLAGYPAREPASPPGLPSGIACHAPRRPMSGINRPGRGIRGEPPGRTEARVSFGAAGRASSEVDQRVKRMPPARCLKPRSGSRAVGLVLLFVVAGPVLAVAMCIAIDLPGVTVNGVTRDRASALDRIDLTETVGLAFPRSVPFANGSGDRPSGFVSDAIALDADNATRMLDAMLVTDETRFGLYDDGNQTNANVTSASFTGSSPTGVNSQVGRPSAQPVPEPSTVLLLGAGLMALAVRRKRLALGGRGGQARHGTFSRLATPGGSGPE